jgi:putative flippase GtrA
VSARGLSRPVAAKGESFMAVSEPGPTAPLQAPAGPLLRLIRDQRVAFVLVGGVNTLVGLGWFLLFHWLVGRYVGYMGTLVLAHICAVLCAFVLHRKLVFRVHGQVLLDLARFELVNLGALAVNAVLLPFFVEIVGLQVVVAQIVATAITIVTTYIGHRAFSFRRSHAHREQLP